MALVRRLLDEGQIVGVLGPESLSLPEHPNLSIFHNLSQAKEFEPNVTLPFPDVKTIGFYGSMPTKPHPPN